MPAKERDLLLKIQEALRKASTPPPTTYAPQTGEVPKPEEYNPNAYPLPVPPSSKT